MIRILAYRFSAFGDVAMLVPVFKEFLEQNPNAEIIMLSRKNFEAIFCDISRLKFYGINLSDYKGIGGLKKLSDELYQQYHPQIVGDFHQVLRTNILNFFFKLRKLPVYQLDKGRAEKKQLIKISNLNKYQLPKTTERYADIFRKMGFSLTLSHQLRPISENKEGIGFAPFAQHYGKMLPLEKSFELAKKLAQTKKVYFLGGGKSEIEILAQWEKEIPNTESLAGKLSLNEELQKIANMETMISMDSANMHLASLVGTRCISIWGATHPFAGFYPYGQDSSNALLADRTIFPLIPTSVFGNKYPEGYEKSITTISLQDILNKIDSFLEK